MYVIARHREWTFGGWREDGSAWEVKVPVLGSRPVRVATRDAEAVRLFVSHYLDEVREANVKGQPLTPFPTDEELKRRGEKAARAEQARRQKALTRPAGRFEDLQRRRCSGSEIIKALEQDAEMMDWHLDSAYQELASFHVSSTARGLRPRPSAMPAVVMRWIRQWRMDLRAALKETDAPIDRVPTDGGRTIDYTLTKWTFENIHRAPRWRRDEAILRREKQLANRSQALASQRGEERAEDYKKWKLWLSDLADAAEIRLGEKPGATLGVKGMKRKRRPKTDHLPLIFRLSEIYKRRPAEEILRAEGFSLQASVSSLLKETAIYAAVAARLGLIEGRSLEVAKRGAKIIRSRLDRDPLR